MKRLDSPDEPENDGSGDWIPRSPVKQASPQ
jgi:hypothetical protein